MSKFTSGPWHVGVRQAERIVYNQKGWAIANATVYHGKETDEECKANARLIAACPELVDVAIAILSYADCYTKQELIDKATSALKKAGII